MLPLKLARFRRKFVTFSAISSPKPKIASGVGINPLSAKKLKTALRVESTALSNHHPILVGSPVGVVSFIPAFFNTPLMKPTISDFKVAIVNSMFLEMSSR